MECRGESSVSKQDQSSYPETMTANAEAVRKVAEAVQGTLGPKGLDTMLVKDDGGVIVTNDGVTILNRMEIHHPVAQMIVGIANAQQEEVGDGTTTATLLAAALVEEGVKQVNRGVPVAKVIVGIRRGVRFALDKMQNMAQMIRHLNDEWLHRIAYTAGREREDITELVMEAATSIGREKLLERDFRLSDAVMAHPRARGSIFHGLLLSRGRVNMRLSDVKEHVRVAVMAGDLHPELVNEDALATEAGFAKHEELKQTFEQMVRKLIELEVGLVVVEGNVDTDAIDALTDAGILVAENVKRADIDQLADYTGACVLRRAGLKRSLAELEPLIGFCEEVEDDPLLGWLKIKGKKDQSVATIVISATTKEVADEQERIAKDAAAAVQAAVRGGFLPGGGAAELALAREVEKYGNTVQGMESFGVSAVAQALCRPIAQMVANAGFNPLEKVEEVKALQWKRSTYSLGIDCDRGVVCDMVDMGVIDPLPVKYHALQTAGEVSTAILRIHTVVKMRNTEAESLR